MYNKEKLLIATPSKTLFDGKRSSHKLHTHWSVYMR